MGFIKSSNHQPTNQPVHRICDSIIIFKRFGNRKIFDLQNTDRADKIISVYYLFDE